MSTSMGSSAELVVLTCADEVSLAAAWLHVLEGTGHLPFVQDFVTTVPPAAVTTAP
jgi:hypothetical protein